MNGNEISKSFFQALPYLIGISGWVTFLYERMTGKPKIQGKILNTLITRLINPAFPEYPTAFFPYVYITNKRKFSVHILDYELELDTGEGFQKMERVYGADKIHVPIDDSGIKIPDLGNIILTGGKENVIEYGSPFHGFVMFVTQRPQKEFVNKIKKIKFTCIDAFDNRHVITTTPKKYINMALLQELSGISISRDHAVLSEPINE